MRALVLAVVAALTLSLCGISFGESPEPAIRDSVYGDVYFGAWSAELTPDAKKTLNEVYRWMKAHPDAVVLLAGYDEQRTPEKQGVEMGWRRAKAVSDYLVSLDISQDRIKMISFGNTRIAVEGEGEAVWSKNRRVRYRVVEPVDTEKIEGKPSGVCQRCKK